MTKRAFVTLLVLMAFGCESPAEETDAAVAADAAVARFAQATGDTWRVVREDAQPRHLASLRSGRIVLKAGADAVETTLGLLSEHRALFRMHDPSLELATERVQVDDLGMTHARFQQTTHGLVVDGAEVTAHYDAVGHLASVDTTYVSGLERLDLSPSISAEEAIVRARAVVGDAESSDLELVVHGETSRLAWRFRLRTETPALFVTYVDAKTGAVLAQWDDLQNVQATGIGALGQPVTFEVTQTADGYVMTDTSGGVTISTYTAKNQQTPLPGTLVASPSLTSWDTNVPGAGAAVDAHANAAIVFKYYKDRHGRNAINGAGGPLVSTAHFGNAYDNASWDPQRQQMLYGDGGQLFRPLSAGLDVVAHEFTHGVIGATSNLEYRNQSGALNEAISDIFAAFIEHTVKPDAANNWRIGELIVRRGSALRDMANPLAVEMQQPAHMSQFVNTLQNNGGVHINSGIINNAAFLMTVGGTNPVSRTEVKFGIGWEKSEKLWYRANTTYFQRTTNFGLAAQGLLQAAKDLQLSAAETNIVDCALKATGILQGTCATIVDPTTAAAAPTPPTNETPGTTPTTPDTGTAGPGAEEPTVAPRRTVRRPVTTTTGGCNAAPSSATSPLALLAAALLLRRRKRA